MEKIVKILSYLFAGLAILLPICNIIDVFEYIPSTRATRRCHYYDPEDNPACTFGVWHPLAAEKLLVYHLNVNNVRSVFQDGFVTVNGFAKYSCWVVREFPLNITKLKSINHLQSLMNHFVVFCWLFCFRFENLLCAFASGFAVVKTSVEERNVVSGIIAARV